MSKIAHILAIKASSLIPLIGSGFGLKPIDDTVREDLFQRGHAELWCGPRPVLEGDTSFWQPIPYIVLRHEDKILSYIRAPSGGESRLHDKISIGFGGHVDAEDSVFVSQHGTIDWLSTMSAAALRELEEELGYKETPILPELNIEWTHLIQSQDTLVDKVHLGLVCEIDLTDKNWNPDLTSAEDTATNLQWLSWAELAALTDPENRDGANPETWTRLLIAGNRCSC